MAAQSTQVSEAELATSVDDIPGWFPWLDQRVFEHLLGRDAVVPAGDLVELGVYLGKSAALMGRFLQDGETFTVCDLFGSDPDDAANQRENRRSYPTLDREKFEANYLGVHGTLPVVVQAASSQILEYVAPGTARFVHVDASHMYDHVAADVQSARTMLVEDGIVVFDDYRSAHTPGVAAAVWQAVFTGGLKLVALTDQKLYGTFGDPTRHQAALETWAAEARGVKTTTQSIAGAPVLRGWVVNGPKKSVQPTKVAPVADPSAPLLQRIDTRLASLDARLGTVETAVRKIRRLEPDFATKLVRKVRAARKR